MKLNKLNIVVSVFLTAIIMLSGCYSFTGGSLPEHLKTVNISAVIDKSGYGNPLYKDNLFAYLTDEFNRDGSLSLSGRNSDSKLEVSITGIKEQAASISGSDFEKERKVVITAKAVFYDNVEKKTLTEKSISGSGVFDVSDGRQGRDDAVDIVLRQLAEDIMFAIVSGW